MDDCPHVDEATGERHHKYDKDGFCIFCGNKKPAHASELLEKAMQHPGIYELDQAQASE